MQAQLDALTNADDIAAFIANNSAVLNEADAKAAKATEPEPAKEPAPTPEPVADPAAPAAEPTAEEKAAQEEAAEEAAEAAGKKPTNRFRFNDDTDRKVANVARAMGISLIEAAEIVSRKIAPATQAAPAAPAARADGLPATAEATQAKLTELRAARQKARKDDADIFKAQEITEEIEVLMEHKSVMQANEQRLADQTARQQAEQGATAASAAMQRTVASYPLCLPEAQNTPEGQAFTAEMQRIYTQMEADGNPLLQDPGHYFKLAQMAGNNLGIAPGQAAPKAPAARAATTAPRLAARPAPIVSGTARTAVPVVARDGLLQKLDAVGTMDELNQLLGKQDF